MAVGCLVGNTCEILPGVATGEFWVECVCRYWELKFRNENGAKGSVAEGVHRKEESRL